MQKILLCFFMLLLGACSHVSFPGVFKIDVAQGNLVTEEMLKKLKPGMTKEQVVYVLGSPTLEDTFHADRWDYPYSYSRGGKEPTTHLLTLYFNNNLYQKSELVGDLKPHERAKSSAP